jgi:hypothetical protein
MKLADLYVKLGLKDKDFNKGLEKSKKKTSKFGSAMKKLGGIMAAAFAVKKVFQFGKASVQAANIQMQAEKKLAQAIESNGKSVQSTMNDYTKFASELQKVTTVGDEATLQLLQLAETMQSPAPKEATKGAIGLSKAYGIDMNSALKMVVLAQKGEYTMLQRYIPELRSATSEAEKHAIVQRAMADGLDIAKKEAETGLGPVTQLKNAWGDFTEQLGKYLMPIIQKVAKWLSELVNKLKGSGGAFQKFIDKIKGFFKANEQITNALRNIGALFGKVWKANFKTFKSIALNIISLVLAIVNQFIELYNRSEKVRIAFGAIKTAFQAMWKVGIAFLESISEGFGTLVTWIKSGFKGDVWGEFFNETKKKWKDAIKDIGNDAKANLDQAINGEPLKLIVIPESNEEEAEEKGKQDGKAYKKGFNYGALGSGKMTGATSGVRETTDEEKAKQQKPDDGIALVDMSNALGDNKALQEKMDEQLKIWGDFKGQMAKVVEDFANEVVVGFAESMGEMIAAGNVDPGELGKQLLGQIGSLLSSLGKMLISLGIGSEAFQKLLGSGLTNPVSAGLAIAAGAALVAIGAGIKKKAQGAASGGGSTSAASGGGGSTSRTRGVGASAEAMNIEVNLAGVLKGNDIKLSTDRTNYKNNAIG